MRLLVDVVLFRSLNPLIGGMFDEALLALFPYYQRTGIDRIMAQAPIPKSTIPMPTIPKSTTKIIGNNGPRDSQPRSPLMSASFVFQVIVARYPTSAPSDALTGVAQGRFLRPHEACAQFFDATFQRFLE